MSSANKTNEQVESESEELTSDTFSDLTLTTSEGEVVHIDVSIVHSAIKAVHTAARNSPQGFYNQLIKREEAKLKKAQSWLNDPTQPDIPFSHDQDRMEVDPDPGASANTVNTMPQTNSTSGASPSLKDTSNDGKRRFIPFVLSSTGRLGPRAATFFAELCKEARKRGHDFTAMGPTNADPAVVASLREDASWANRNFPSWAKQTISLAVCTSKGLAIDRLLRNDKLTNLTQRGIGVSQRPPGAVGYSTNFQLGLAILQSKIGKISTAEYNNALYG